MIRFVPQTGQFAAKTKYYNPSDISPKLMYEWIKTGNISLADFELWLTYTRTKLEDVVL